MKRTTFLIINAAILAIALIIWPVGIYKAVMAGENKIPGHIGDVIKKTLKIGNLELAPLGEGLPLTRQVESEIEAELIIGGAVKIQVPLAFIREHYKVNIPMNRRQTVAENGVFHNPPQGEDLKKLIIDESDIEALRTCRVQECNIKLPADAIENFQRTLDPADPDYAPKADSLYRRFLLERAAAYLAHGVSGLNEYSDQNYTLIQSEEYLDILKNSKLIDNYDGRLRKYLKEYPTFKMDGIRESLVWSREIYDALRPLITLNHIIVYEKKADSREFLVTQSQFYASHYYESSLEVTLIISDENEESPGTYYIFSKRARFDTLRRPDFWGVKKSRLRSGVEQGVRDLLAAVKQETETAYQTFLAGQE